MDADVDTCEIDDICAGPGVGGFREDDEWLNLHLTPNEQVPRSTHSTHVLGIPLATEEATASTSVTDEGVVEGVAETGVRGGGGTERGADDEAIELVEVEILAAAWLRSE
jgi:hypothetical protein